MCCEKWVKEAWFNEKRIFSAELYLFFLCVLYFNTFCDAYAIDRQYTGQFQKRKSDVISERFFLTILSI